jgi:hypothetical protein
MSNKTSKCNKMKWLRDIHTLQNQVPTHLADLSCLQWVGDTVVAQPRRRGGKKEEEKKKEEEVGHGFEHSAVTLNRLA